MESTESSSFRLLELPTEMIEFIFQYIALLDYDYPESRRPQITPIEALAFTYNYRIRQLAAPLYFRCRGRTNHPIFPMQYVIGKRRVINPFELTYIYGRRPLVDGSLKKWRRIESFIFGTGLLYSMADDDNSVVPWQAFPNLRHLHICSSGYPYHLLQSDEASPPKSLTSVTIGPQATLRWLQHFSEPSNLINTVTVDRTKRHRNIGERLATFNTWEISSDFWRRLRSFTLRLPSPSQFGGTKAVERYLEGFEVCLTSSALHYSRDQPLSCETACYDDLSTLALRQRMYRSDTEVNFKTAYEHPSLARDLFGRTSFIASHSRH